MQSTRTTGCLIGLNVLAGCTTVEPPPKIDVPVAYAQTPEEVGKFPAGRIVEVSIQAFDATIPLIVGTQNGTVFVPVGKAFIPIPAPTLGSFGIFKKAKKQEFYRYGVKIKGKEKLEFWDDFVNYPIGSCIALRDEPSMVIPALIQACE